MPMISESKFPPGGWQFFQPQTQWPKSQSVFAGLTLDQVCVEVAKNRIANPRFGLSTDLVDIKEEVKEYNCARIKYNPHYCTGGPPGKAPAPPRSPSGAGLAAKFQSAKSAVAAAVNKVGHLAIGVDVLLEWLGSGGHTVLPEMAEKRAATCARCPQNYAGGWETYFTGPVTNKIRQQLSIKNQMDLKTTSDDRISVCKACDCPLRLKVWVPIEHVLKGLKPLQRSELDKDCWILAESP